jgi:ATP-dependent Lon protease
MFKKPVMYLRDSIIFPNSKESSLLIGREDSIKAMDLSISSYNSEICIITQTQGEDEAPEDTKTFPLGTVCKIVKCMKFSDGTRKILIQGEKAFNVSNIVYENKVRLVEGYECKWSESSDCINNEDKEEVLNLLKKYNNAWINESKENFENYFSHVSRLDEFVLKASQLIASPYSGVQKKEELAKVKRDFNYWKKFGKEHIEDMNGRIGKRVNLLTAMPSVDKLKVIKDILISETS